MRLTYCSITSHYFILRQLLVFSQRQLGLFDHLTVHSLTLLHRLGWTTKGMPARSNDFGFYDDMMENDDMAWQKFILMWGNLPDFHSSLISPGTAGRCKTASPLLQKQVADTLQSLQINCPGPAVMRPCIFISSTCSKCNHRYVLRILYEYVILEHRLDERFESYKRFWSARSWMPEG